MVPEQAKMLPNILLPVLSVVATNALIFSLKWDSTSSNSLTWLDPPGELIGTVWVVLFILIGIARYHVQKSGHAEAPRFTRLIIYYMLFCLSYPFYTIGLSSEVMGLIGNAATFAVAAYLVAMVRKISTVAAWCLSPVLPWILYATATILA